MTVREPAMPAPAPGAMAPLRAMRVNGVELHYTDSETEGDAVVLLHGGMGDLGSWPHQCHALSPSYRVVAYSRRDSHPNRNEGTGEGRAYRLEDDIEDFLALQTALDTGAAHLVATSYGALLALAIALRAPGRVASLVLVEPPLHRWLRTTEAGRALYDAFIRDVWRAAAQAFEGGLPRRAMQLLIQGMWGRPMPGSWPDDRIDAAMRNAAAMRALTRADDPFPDFERSDVSRLTTPTLLLQGDRTSALHAEVMNQLGQVMAHARRVEIPCAGHGSANENPAAFNAAIVPFLQSIRPPSGGMR